MYDTLEIKNLRGIKEAKVEDLAPLSVFVGPNNSGKSTLLEGFHLALADGDVARLGELAHRRGWCGEVSVEQLRSDPQAPISTTLLSGQRTIPSKWHIDPGCHPNDVSTLQRSPLSDKIWRLGGSNPEHSARTYIDDDGATLTTRPSPPPNQPLSRLLGVDSITAFGKLEDAYSDAINAGREPELDALIHETLDPTARLRILKRGKRFVLHVVDESSGSVAVYNMGDGFKRLLYLASVFASSAGTVLLLEEPEAFQHPRFIKELARMIWVAIRQGTQIVISTHSEDLLRQLFSREDIDLNKSAIFKTRLNEGVLRTVRIDGPRAHERITDLSEDLRW